MPLLRHLLCQQLPSSSLSNHIHMSTYSLLTVLWMRFGGTFTKPNKMSMPRVVTRVVKWAVVAFYCSPFKTATWHQIVGILEDLVLGENTCAVWVLLYAHILINKECCSSMLLFLQMVIKIIDNKDPLLCLHSSQFPSCCTCKYCPEILHVPQSALFYLTCTCSKFSSYSVCERKLERRLGTPQWLSYQNIWK